jgi:hypothetical protein
MSVMCFGRVLVMLQRPSRGEEFVLLLNGKASHPASTNPQPLSINVHTPNEKGTAYENTLNDHYQSTTRCRALRGR